MDGISFIVRARNEEQLLEQSLQSLKGITIPHEIIIILHMCTDRSKEIAERLSNELPIKIIEYNIPVSRAGYENMVTDSTSCHSLVSYYNWSFSHSNYIWKFKWDADFIASPEMRAYLNTNIWGKGPSIKIFFIAKSPDADNSEGYLFRGNFMYKKYFFWEFLEGEYQDTHTGISIEHASKLSDLKSYWNEQPWFFNWDSDEARTIFKRYKSLCAICGDELRGQARASNPEGANIEWNVKSKATLLEALDIHSSR